MLLLFVLAKSSQPTEKVNTITILKSAITLSFVDKRRFKVSHLPFLYYYTAAVPLLEDFKRWLCLVKMQQKSNAALHVQHVTSLWSLLDPSFKVLPTCTLFDENLLMDYYAAPLIRIIKEQQEVAQKRTKTSHPAIDNCQQARVTEDVFRLTRCIFAGMKNTDIDVIKGKIKEIISMLKPLIKQREVDLKSSKRSNVLTQSVMDKYFNSKHVKEVRKKLLNLDYLPTKVDVVDARDYLLIMICMFNATRASNLINIMCSDIDDMVQDATFPDAWCFKSDRYKTSLLYGTKVIIVDEPLKHELEKFVMEYVPVLSPMTDATKQPLFGTIRKSKISHSAISNGMSKSFRKAGDFHRLCPTRIRVSIATEICGIGEENLTEFATVSNFSVVFVQNFAYVHKLIVFLILFRHS